VFALKDAVGDKRRRVGGAVGPVCEFRTRQRVMLQRRLRLAVCLRRKAVGAKVECSNNIWGLCGWLCVALVRTL